MSTSLKKGWLKDVKGQRFAPNTLASQVFTSDNQSLESRIQSEHDELTAGIKILLNTNISILNLIFLFIFLVFYFPHSDILWN